MTEAVAEPLDVSHPTPLHVEAARCRRLWAAVALAAMDDAKRCSEGARYLTTADFLDVLALAGIDHDAAALIARRITGD